MMFQICIHGVNSYHVCCFNILPSIKQYIDDRTRAILTLSILPYGLRLFYYMLQKCVNESQTHTLVKVALNEKMNKKRKACQEVATVVARSFKKRRVADGCVVA